MIRERLLRLTGEGNVLFATGRAGPASPELVEGLGSKRFNAAFQSPRDYRGRRSKRSEDLAGGKAFIEH